MTHFASLEKAMARQSKGRRGRVGQEEARAWCTVVYGQRREGGREAERAKSTEEVKKDLVVPPPSTKAMKPLALFCRWDQRDDMRANKQGSDALCLSPMRKSSSASSVRSIPAVLKFGQGA